MRSLQQFWSVRRIGEDRVTLARLGTMRLWLARADKEWGFACHYGDQCDLMDFAQVPEDVVPEKLSWTNILFRDAPRDYVFEAVAPQKAITVRMANHVGIPKGESASFFVTTPVEIGIRVMSEGGSQRLGIVCSEKLPRSWFGTTVSGKMTCESPVSLQMEFEQVLANPNQIVYQVDVMNRSGDMMSFDKICLDLRQTGLYSGTGHLWGTQVSLEYHGQNSECLIQYSDKVPGGEDGVLEVVPPVKHEARDLPGTVISCCHLL